MDLSYHTLFPTSLYAINKSLLKSKKKKKKGKLMYEDTIFILFDQFLS